MPAMRACAKKRALAGALSRSIAIAMLGGDSRRIVHLEFHRMRGVLEADDFAHLQLDIGVDEVVVEDAARLEEAAILVELLEGLPERAAYGGDLLELGRRQV